MYEEN